MAIAKKPSEAEEEYFARVEAEKKRQRSLSAAQALGQQERERLRALHHMRCPKCGMQLSQLSLAGVQVERCFGCNGIFLDEQDVHELIREENDFSRTLHFFDRGNYSKDPSQ